MNKLTQEETEIILNKKTETPFKGEYYMNFKEGTYSCKQCGADLYDSIHEFHSNCGWPSFDDAIPGSVKRIPGKDGVRTEIVCSKCGGHLGHVFMDEGLTPKNTRYCVNSLALKFNPKN